MTAYHRGHTPANAQPHGPRTGSVVGKSESKILEKGHRTRTREDPDKGRLVMAAPVDDYMRAMPVGEGWY